MAQPSSHQLDRPELQAQQELQARMVHQPIMMLLMRQTQPPRTLRMLPTRLMRPPLHKLLLDRTARTVLRPLVLSKSPLAEMVAEPEASKLPLHKEAQPKAT